VDDHGGELQPPARAQDAVDLGEHGLLVGHAVDDAVRDDHVDGCVRERQRLDQRLVQRDCAQAHRSCALARAPQHPRRHVDADDATAGPAICAATGR
jgi:hypothetical protein